MAIISAGMGRMGSVVDSEQSKSRDSITLVLRREFPLLGAYVAPRTPMEQKLAEIFCTALGMDQVSVTDDFEELGGDSLMAVRICADIEAAFDVSVPIAFIVNSPTIERLAPRVDDLISRRSA
jgi:acyl carrier protein